MLPLVNITSQTIKEYLPVQAVGLIGTSMRYLDMPYDGSTGMNRRENGSLAN